MSNRRGVTISSRAAFGPQKAIALLRLEYPDGAPEIIPTDTRWQAGLGPITYSHVYGGEDYDARLDTPKEWVTAAATAGPGGTLRGGEFAAPPIRAIETLKGIAGKELRPGVTVYDLGQNASVMPRISVRGPAAQR